MIWGPLKDHTPLRVGLAHRSSGRKDSDPGPAGSARVGRLSCVAWVVTCEENAAGSSDLGPHPPWPWVSWCLSADAPGWSQVGGGSGRAAGFLELDPAALPSVCIRVHWPRMSNGGGARAESGAALVCHRAWPLPAQCLSPATLGKVPTCGVTRAEEGSWPRQFSLEAPPASCWRGCLPAVGTDSSGERALALILCACFYAL